MIDDRRRCPKKRTMGDAVKHGIGFGIGILIVNALFGPTVVVKHETAAKTPAPASAQKTNIIKAASGPCSNQFKAFQDCVNSSNASNINKCQAYMDKLQECRRASGWMN